MKSAMFFLRSSRYCLRVTPYSFVQKEQIPQKSMYIEPISLNNTITRQNHEYQTCIEPLNGTNSHKIPASKDLLR